MADENSGRSRPTYTAFTLNETTPIALEGFGVLNASRPV